MNVNFFDMFQVFCCFLAPFLGMIYFVNRKYFTSKLIGNCEFVVFVLLAIVLVFKVIPGLYLSPYRMLCDRKGIEKSGEYLAHAWRGALCEILNDRSTYEACEKSISIISKICNDSSQNSRQLYNKYKSTNQIITIFDGSMKFKNQKLQNDISLVRQLADQLEGLYDICETMDIDGNQDTVFYKIFSKIHILCLSAVVIGFKMSKLSAELYGLYKK